MNFDRTERLIAEEPISFSLALQPPEADQADALLSQDPIAARAEAQALSLVPPSQVEAIVRYVTRHGLRVRQVPSHGLFLEIEGRAHQVQAALGHTLYYGYCGESRYRCSEGELALPDELRPLVRGAIGLETHATLHPLHRRPPDTDSLPNGGLGYGPQDIQNAYDIPSDLLANAGQGQSLAILEFSNGYAESDLQLFSKSFGRSSPLVRWLSVDGEQNDNGSSPNDIEATLDVEWAGAFLPAAEIVVFGAPAGSSNRSFARSMLHALHAVLSDGRCQVVSISYGDGEGGFAPQVMQSWNNLMRLAAASGISVVVASGDQGAYGLHAPFGPFDRHADTPASCPYALSVGGTHLDLQNGQRLETGWTDIRNNGASGGGFSNVFARPSWQPCPGFAEPGRGVPDVSLNADPLSGYAVAFQGTLQPVGGTSVAAPIWAALLTLVNQQRAGQGQSSLGFITPKLYTLGEQPVFHDIVNGNNSYMGVRGFSCGPGWDPVTGLGSLDFAQLLKVLR